MKFPPPVLLAAIVLAPMAVTTAQIIGTDDAADQFFRGFVLKKDAETMEQEGNFQGALSLYQQMKSIFDSVAKANPDWQPAMLNNRRALTDQAIARVQARLAQPAPTSTPATMPLTASPGVGASPLFGVGTNGTIPAPGDVAAT
ncbi:MAG: hypothetical protein LDL31_12930, partial [Prosthecobacter sp.]|nr:hypothetical protein [Prosthecobacter sp.]